MSEVESQNQQHNETIALLMHELEELRLSHKSEMDACKLESQQKIETLTARHEEMIQVSINVAKQSVNQLRSEHDSELA